ncbi:MAG: helix-turn-helix domain-containing protein [Clostridiales bacterium]|nr:helix-turn-helix domain-containing protein [Clostridiales bacterium]
MSQFWKESDSLNTHSHLTLNDRFIIASLLDQQHFFKSIGAQLDKNCTTISKEVRSHRGCDHRKICSACNSNRYFRSCRKCTFTRRFKST